jgi:diguanylate cyclase (GGDEF)-like protein
LEFALLWTIFFLSMRALAVFAGEFQSLRSMLTETKKQLRIAENKAEQLVRHDALTGALNRRGLIDMLDSELQRASRTGHPFCFAALDLDHFKKINDKYGHATGDAVLKTMSDTSMRLLRALDRFGRLDGEEFGIVMPATWLDQGAIAMSRLTKAVNGQNWEGIAPGLILTFSAGLTTNAPGDTAESLILRAEKAMRQAKSEGRNRIVQAEEPLPVSTEADL